MDLIDTPHRRYNPLSDRWVMVSPYRTSRPWQGQTEPAATDERPAYDPDCYLCPGNVRASGERNPDYAGTWTFVNDLAALQPDSPATSLDQSPLLRADGQPGTCRVLCFHPRHELTVARMSVQQIRTIVDLWAAQVAELAPRYAWVQVFQNEGEAMGASNPHPHGQLWAMTRLPNEAAVEDQQQRAWREAHDTPQLVDYLTEELDGPRDRAGASGRCRRVLHHGCRRLPPRDQHHRAALRHHSRRRRQRRPFQTTHAGRSPTEVTLMSCARSGKVSGAKRGPAVEYEPGDNHPSHSKRARRTG